MKRALLIGAEDRRPEQEFRPAPSLAALQSLLDELGGWSITRVEGPAASRDGVLAALDELARALGPADTCLVYFIGHGGVVEITDLPPPLGHRPVFYICVARSGDAWSFDGVLDVELSLCLARMDRVCGNVSAILDCCYSARTVRGPLLTLHESPAWVHEVAGRGEAREVDELLRVSGHPRVVRLAASSSLRMTYADAVPDGHLGRLTRLFIETVREAELQLERLTWDALAHRVRERAIWRLGCEEQWVSLIGPRQRLVFSAQEVELPRTVGFVPREHAPGGWIRAGALQGVREGDEWGLAELTLDAEQRPRLRGRLRVATVDLNRAVLEPVGGDDTAPPGTSAVLLRAHELAPVSVHGPPAARATVAASAWLTPRSSDDALGELHVEAHAIELLSPRDAHAPARFPAGEAGLAAAIDRLEDWARARLLSAVARSQPPRSLETTMKIELGRFHNRHGSQRPCVLSTHHERPSLSVGERMFVRIAHLGEHSEWFVSVIEIDVAGRPRLFDESEPEGRELLDGEVAMIGEHPHRQVQGLELRWPEGVGADRPRRATIIVLASRRPIQLGHLVRGPSGELRVPRDTPRARRATVRGHLARARPRTGPELAEDWGAISIAYQLDPRKPG